MRIITSEESADLAEARIGLFKGYGVIREESCNVGIIFVRLTGFAADPGKRSQAT